MKRILVAGASGYLGGFVVRELKARGCFVRALARSRERVDHLGDSVDEVFVGQVTQPGTLIGACDTIDVVFSSVGITRQNDGLTFRDVDYRGNRNLLENALRSGVSKFVYVSACKGPELRHLDIVGAHEEFVDELEASGLAYAVLRPTGYFSDLGEIFRMARKGRIWLIGSGEHRFNPIHGADLAIDCADAIEDDAVTKIELGGPEIVTWNQAARLAFEVVGRPPRISHLPQWLAWSIVRLIRLINQHQGELLAFFTTMATIDVVAPRTGTHTLEAHFRSLAEEAS